MTVSTAPRHGRTGRATTTLSAGRRRRRPLAGTAALLMAAGTLAACGGGDTGGAPTLTWYINPDSGGQAEIADAAAAIARDAMAGKIDPDRISEKTIQRYLYHPEVPEVDMFLRPSGEERISNFMLWQSAYAELVFLDTLWPDFDGDNLRAALAEYARGDPADAVSETQQPTRRKSGDEPDRSDPEPCGPVPWCKRRDSERRGGLRHWRDYGGRAERGTRCEGEVRRKKLVVPARTPGPSVLRQ